MGLDPSLTVVVGTRIPKEVYEENFDRDINMIDEMSDDLVGFNGGEYQHDTYVIGQIAYRYNGYGDTNVVKDLVSEFASKRTETKEMLESELGIVDREVSLLIVGACR